MSTKIKYMKKYLLLLSLLFVTLLSADTYVDGYTRSDGTYVQGHYRSSLNDTVTDNFSTDGNVNPYTGVEGSRNVDEDSYDYSDSPNDSTNLYASQSNNNNDVETFLIILGAIAGLAVVIYLWKLARKQLFLRYLASKIKVTFWTWVFLTVLNQVVFFGACLAPYCILASIPHVSLITFGIMYLTYKSALETYDPETGYNEFGYDKDGYDMNGYGMDGYDKHSYNAQGIDRDGKDRLGMSYISRKIFASTEVREKLVKMNVEAIEKNKVDQTSKHHSSEEMDTLTLEEKSAPPKKAMSEMDKFFNEPTKEDQ